MNKTKLSNKLEKKKFFFKNIICKITKVNFVYAVLLLIIILGNGSFAGAFSFHGFFKTFNFNGLC